MWIIVNLLTLSLLARSRTIALRSIFRTFSVSIPWALGIAFFTQWVVDMARLSLIQLGPSIYMAGFLEESLKLFPFVVLALIAPGRMRRFSAVDYFLLGCAMGGGFQAAEDGVRKMHDSVVGSWIRQMFCLGDGVPYAFNPWVSGSIPGISGEVSPSHFIYSGTIAVAIGMGIHLWRSKSATWQRPVGIALPIVVAWLAICTHSGYNASVQFSPWTLLGPSNSPLFMRIGWLLTVHGHLFIWLSFILFVCAVLFDTSRRLDAGDAGEINTGIPRTAGQQAQRQRKNGIAGALASAPEWLTALPRVIVASVRFTIDEVCYILNGFDPTGTTRFHAMVNGRFAREEVLNVRRKAMAATTPGVEPPARNWFRLIAVALGLAATLVCIAAGTGFAYLADKVWESDAPTLFGQAAPAIIGPAEADFFAGLLRTLANWWDGLGFGGQLLVTALLALTLMAFGAPFALSLGAAGVITWFMEHGHGVARLLEDPKAAVREYWENVTLEKLLLDTFDFATTFIPWGRLTALLGRTTRPVARVTVPSHVGSAATATPRVRPSSAAGSARPRPASGVDGPTLRPGAGAGDAAPHRVPDPPATAAGSGGQVPPGRGGGAPPRSPDGPPPPRDPDGPTPRGDGQQPTPRGDGDQPRPRDGDEPTPRDGQGQPTPRQSGDVPPWHTETLDEAIARYNDQITTKLVAQDEFGTYLDDFVKEHKLPDEYANPSLYTVKNRPATIRNLRRAGMDPDTINDVMTQAGRVSQQRSAQTQIAEVIGDIGGERYLYGQGYEIPPAFRSDIAHSPGPFTVDGFAVRGGGQEIVVPEFKGMNGKIDSTPVPLLDGTMGVQGEAAYTFDRMLRDQRVAQYFHDNPQVWQQVLNGDTTFTLKVIKTDETMVTKATDVAMKATQEWISAMGQLIAQIG